MIYTVAGFVTDTVDSFVVALLEWLVQAWDYIVTVALSVACPLITELFESPAFVDFAVQAVTAWNWIAVYISQANYYVPAVETVVMLAAYEAWNLVYMFVRAGLKLTPFIW